MPFISVCLTSFGAVVGSLHHRVARMRTDMHVHTCVPAATQRPASLTHAPTHPHRFTPFEPCPLRWLAARACPSDVCVCLCVCVCVCVCGVDRAKKDTALLVNPPTRQPFKDIPPVAPSPAAGFTYHAYNIAVSNAQKVCTALNVAFGVLVFGNARAIAIACLAAACLAAALPFCQRRQA